MPAYTRCALCALLLLTAPVAAGCDAVERLRSFFRTDALPPDALQGMLLEVEVEPARNISILIDGVHVANASPFATRAFGPGRHLLEVRAMGYHPVSLPISLEAGRLLRVPVSLRRRAPEEPTPSSVAVVPPSASPKSAASTAPAGEAPPATPTPAPPNTTAPMTTAEEEKTPAPAPATVSQPVQLQIRSQPPLMVRLDGAAAPDAVLTLNRPAGVLSAGDLQLNYTLDDQGILRLSVPQDSATWSRDNQPLQPGTSFTLLRGATRLVRATAGGAEQMLFLRRF